jgi:hypothetical protein
MKKVNLRVSDLCHGFPTLLIIQVNEKQFPSIFVAKIGSSRTSNRGLFSGETILDMSLSHRHA